jgi:hypothetical protein
LSVEDVVRGMRALDEAAPAYEEAEQYYEGRANEVFADPKIARRLGQYGASFRANFAKVPVNAIANKLKITSITVPGNDKATDRITEIRDLLGLVAEEKAIHRKAGEYGDAFVLVIPVDADPDPSDDQAVIKDDPATSDDDPTIQAGWGMFYNSPLCARIIYDDDYPLRKLYAIKRWRLADKRWRVRLEYANFIENWITKGKTDGLKPSHWVEEYDYDPETGAQLPWPIVTDNGQLPWFHFRNGTPYGTPDHKEAYGPQNGITKVLASQTASVDAAAFGDRWGLLDPAAEVNANLDDPDADDDAQVGTVGNQGGQRTNLRSGPGSFTLLPGVKAVGEWGKAEPGALTSTLEQWIGIMAQVTGVPMKEFKVGGVTPAAESDRQRQLEFNDMIRDRQPMYGSEWAKIWRFILRTDDLLTSDADQVKVAWDAPEDLDDADSWGVTGLKLQSGVPARQALSERGYSTDQLDKWGITDDTSPNVVDELVKVAGMAQQLGAAVSLGVLDQASAASYVNAALAAAVQGVRVQQGSLPQPPSPALPPNGRPPQLEPAGTAQ